MSLLNKKLLKEAATEPKESAVDNSLYTIFVDVVLTDEIAAQKLLRFATKRNVSIEVLELEGEDKGAHLVGSRAEVQRVYKKFWAKSAGDDNLDNFKEEIKKYRPKVYHEYDVSFDIMKLTPKVCSELLQAGVIIRDYNDDKKTGRLLGGKLKVAEVARLYFDKGDFDRKKIEKIKEDLNVVNFNRKLAGLEPLKESYDYFDEPTEVELEESEEGDSEFEDSLEATEFMDELRDDLQTLVAKFQDDRIEDWIRATAENFSGGEEVANLFNEISNTLLKLEGDYDEFHNKIGELG
jgi:hypothetical protein